MKTVSAVAFVVLISAMLWLLQNKRGDEISVPVAPNESNRAGEASSPELPMVDVPRPAAEPRTDDERVVTVEFDNGRTVALTLRHEPLLKSYIQPIDRLVDVHADMEAAALAGNMAAAVQLYEELLTCANTPASQFELEQELQRLREEGIVRDQYGGQMELPAGADPQILEDYLAANRAYCEGITSQQIDSRVKWLRRAAGAGEYEGFRYLAAELGTSRESFKILEQAWAGGHVNALAELLQRHRTVAATHPERDPDYAEIYALQLNLIKITAAADALGSRIPKLLQQEMEDTLQEAAAFLSPHEQAMAEARAADMLEANVNCCKAYWVWPR